MIYSNYLRETLISDISAILSALPFYFIGAVIAWFLTYLGHAIACSIVKGDRDTFGVCYNPLKNISLFSVLGIISYPIMGVGFTRPLKGDPEERGKTFFISIAGPLFCFAVSLILLLVYSFPTVAFLGSLLLGTASAGICFSIMNILPIPGLCGGVALGMILPEKAAERWLGLSKYYPITVTLALLIIARSQINTTVISKIVYYFSLIAD